MNTSSGSSAGKEIWMTQMKIINTNEAVTGVLKDENISLIVTALSFRVLDPVNKIKYSEEK